mgnify:CR=1 FL=1
MFKISAVYFLKIVLSTIILCLFSLKYSLSETTINTTAKYAVLIDYDTGRILLNKNSNISMAPASMSKLMTIDEAKNDLSFIATGIYGKKLPKQNGAPLRLVLPWKYGFKSIKSIVKISFVKEKPIGLWEKLAPAEYGFWANVNPKVPHPRWSQSTEQQLGVEGRIPTIIYNGYGSQVSSLYKDLEKNLKNNLYI